MTVGAGKRLPVTGDGDLLPSVDFRDADLGGEKMSYKRIEQMLSEKRWGNERVTVLGDKRQQAGSRVMQ